MGSGCPVRTGARAKRTADASARPRHRPPVPLLHQRADPAVAVFRHLQEAVAGPFAPDGHVLADAGVVPHDLQAVSGLELPHLARREEDRQRTEGSGDVEAADGLGRRVSH